jgi:thymidylate synthase (FAD)
MKKQILDHGYIELIESWGSDEAIIEAARMSTAKGFLGWGNSEKPGDEKLLRFLWEKKHSTPFEFGGLTIEVQAPLMVFREWHRHRTQSYSERSARYTPLPDVNYVPTVERMLSGVQSAKGNRQATGVDGAASLTLDSALVWQSELIDVYEHAERVYQSGLLKGVPKELARLSVPVGRYSTMRASANLRNWLGFETLRLPKNAQYEIRVFGEALHEILVSKFPRTMTLFDEGMKTLLA